MINIAICDDNEIFLESIVVYFKQYLLNQCKRIITKLSRGYIINIKYIQAIEG